jgi:hypothetical protein
LRNKGAGVFNSTTTAALSTGAYTHQQRPKELTSSATSTATAAASTEAAKPIGVTKLNLSTLNSRDDKSASVNSNNTHKPKAEVDEDWHPGKSKHPSPVSIIC